MTKPDVLVPTEEELQLLSDPAFLKAIKTTGGQLLSERQIELYQPYEKQHVFHALGADHRERLLMAGNQLGKTFTAAAETTFHLTGEYPDWWPGRRWKKATAGWAGGVTSEVTRDTCQRLLMGRPGQIGTGMIPKRHILETSAARGIADALDTVVVQHKNGGKSTLSFKSYEKGREKWQGETLDFVWYDEEPPLEIYMEGLTRTNATGGMAYMTFTPLMGMSQVVRMFYPRPETGDRAIVQMTIDDALHIPAAQREAIIASYPAHEREARTRGIPMLGSGRIFPIPEASITIDAFTIPAEWPRVAGIDFGWDHPTAGARLAWDRDADVVYVTHDYRVRQATTLQHAAALKAWGDVPFAWPHDGMSTGDRSSGDTLAELYRKQGLDLMWERATFPDGGNGVEAGIAMMLDRMETGRLKVFSHLSQWLEEFRLYHREEGKVVKEHDDILSATRYALMMLRYARRPRDRNAGALKRNLKGIV
jgi:phage terminase large subunit-like protein